MELDKELEAESSRHEKERTVLLTKIKELEGRPENNFEADPSAEQLVVENEKLQAQLEAAKQHISNLGTSIEIFESSTVPPHIFGFSSDDL